MKLYEYILTGYDVKLVGPEEEVSRYRKQVHGMRTLLLELEWSDAKMCPVCSGNEPTDWDDENGPDGFDGGTALHRGHKPECRLAALLQSGNGEST